MQNKNQHHSKLPEKTSTPKKTQQEIKNYDPVNFTDVNHVKKSTSKFIENPTILSNPQEQQILMRQKTLKKMIEANERYLCDKVKVTQIPKPSKYSHKIPSKTGNSEYNRQFHQNEKIKNLIQSTPQRSKLEINNNIGKCNVTDYETSYHSQFDRGGEENEKSAEFQNFSKPKRTYEKPEGPTFTESSYKRDYSSVANSPTISAKRQEVRLMGGGKFNGDSTYHQYYRTKTNSGYQKAKPVIQKNNKIFIEMKNQDRSQYQETFQNKSVNFHPEPSCKPRQKYEGQKSKIKYRTEYNGQYTQQDLNKKADFTCLSNEQVKQFVMNILDEKK